jgi:hypothetical protein
MYGALQSSNERPYLFIHNAPDPQLAQGAIEELEGVVRDNPDLAVEVLSDPLLLSEIPVQHHPQEHIRLSAAIKRIVSVILEQAGSDIRFGFDEETQKALNNDAFVQLARKALSEVDPQTHPAASRLSWWVGREALRVYGECFATYLRNQQRASVA